MSPDSTLERQVRDTLDAVTTGAPVPPLDRTALHRRVGVLRRRRRTGLVLAGGAAAAVLGAAVALPVTVLSGSRETPSGATAQPAPSGLPVALGGQVELLQDDGSLVGTGLAGTPLGELDGRPVVLDGDRLLGAADHPVTGVARAFVDASGVSYQLGDGRVRWSGAPDPDTLIADPGTLLAAGGPAYVVDTAAGLVIHDADGDHRVTLGSDGDGDGVRPDAVEVAGDTVVVVADGTEQVFDLDGTRRSGLLGGATGALSPDGSVWAYAADARERAQGMRAGVVLAPTTGAPDGPRVPLAQAALDLAWFDGALYVLTEGDDQRTVWQCDRADGCRARLITDDTTLALG